MTGTRIRLLRSASLKGSVFFGFPLPDKASFECGERLEPIDPALSGTDRQDEINRREYTINKHLRKLCAPVWPDTMVLVGWGNRRAHIVLGLVACSTGPPDEELLPKEEEMRKLKEIMAEEGFTEEPRWFLSYC
ncbi:hypothetical protein D9615_007237 [Tricholomella constricta]|uniref:Uncharacterized protein n=1 Tax=Tricholomella constricta TaxID=117010 RepID=A0A8H5M0N8_9AGAR|nr:hypothetical protein D9615_007237 [Tricholomella constricta]